jgi:hypothetical protein
MDFVLGAIIYSLGVLTGFALVHATLTSTKAQKPPPNREE